MLQKVEWKCDACEKVESHALLMRPLGWSEVEMSTNNGFYKEKFDVCGDCSPQNCIVSRSGFAQLFRKFFGN